MNRRARRRAAALGRKRRHNAFFEDYIRHLPEIALDEPMRRGHVYHLVHFHDDDCAYYVTGNIADCDCDLMLKRYAEPGRS
jgi:hypothetical protein